MPVMQAGTKNAKCSMMLYRWAPEKMPRKKATAIIRSTDNLLV